MNSGTSELQVFPTLYTLCTCSLRALRLWTSSDLLTHVPLKWTISIYSGSRDFGDLVSFNTKTWKTSELTKFKGCRGLNPMQLTWIGWMSVLMPRSNGEDLFSFVHTSPSFWTSIQWSRSPLQPRSMNVVASSSVVFSFLLMKDFSQIFQRAGLWIFLLSVGSIPWLYVCFRKHYFSRDLSISRDLVPGTHTCVFSTI